MQAYLPSKDDDYKNIQKENLSIALQSVKGRQNRETLCLCLQAVTIRVPRPTRQFINKNLKISRSNDKTKTKTRV